MGGSTEFWPPLLGTLTAVLILSLLIALAVKYRLFQYCRPRNTHSLLLEHDAVGQFQHDAALGDRASVRGMRARMIRRVSGDSYDEDDDEDGFIEDNYIQTSERDIEEQEENQQERIEESDDELLNYDVL